MRPITIFFAYALLAITILVPGPVNGGQAGASAPTSHQAAENKRTTAASPSAQDIADAKRKGLVWVNLKTHVYHKGGAFYGTTKQGKFMTEDEATKGGIEPQKSQAQRKRPPRSRSY